MCKKWKIREENGFMTKSINYTNLFFLIITQNLMHHRSYKLGDLFANFMSYGYKPKSHCDIIHFLMCMCDWFFSIHDQFLSIKAKLSLLPSQHTRHIYSSTSFLPLFIFYLFWCFPKLLSDQKHRQNRKCPSARAVGQHFPQTRWTQSIMREMHFGVQRAGRLEKRKTPCTFVILDAASKANIRDARSAAKAAFASEGGSCVMKKQPAAKGEAADAALGNNP